MELWDLYTKDRVPTGEVHVRGEELPDGRYHIAVHVWIVNSRGKYLISKRDENRPTYPLFWECTGGAVLAGETSLEGAVREVREEIGVTLTPTSGKLLSTEIRGDINGKRFNDFKDVWLFPYDGEVDLSLATEKEVADVMWASPDEIRKMLDEGKFVDTLSYFFDCVAGVTPFD